MADEKVEGKPANEKIISLSQVLLAPLDAIFKAQIHGARSFLNLVLQMGTPHVKLKGEDGVLKKEILPNEDKQLYQQDFYFKVPTANGDVEHKLSIPALALVPLVPLAIDEAQFDFEYTVSHVSDHEQMQGSRADDAEKRPWYLVSDPVSLRGVIAPQSKGNNESEKEESQIKISIKLGKQLTPGGLDKLLTTINQVSSIGPVKPQINNPTTTNP